MKIVIAGAFVSIVAGALLSKAADGVAWKADGGSYSLGSKTCWYGQIIAGDGGKATFQPTTGTLTQNIDGWTLGALDLQGGKQVFKGGDIAFTGSAELIADDSTPKFLCAIKGVEGASLTRRGAGSVGLYGAGPLTGFTVVTNVTGALLATNVAAKAVSDSPMVMRGGRVKLSPALPAGTESFSAALCGGTTLPILGAFRLSFEKGNAAEMTLTIPPPAFDDDYAPLMALAPSGGTASLGGTEKVKVSGTAPEVSGGIADARIVARGVTAGHPMSFVTYDAADGFKPVEPTGAIDDQDAAEKVVKVAANTTLAADATVRSLVVEGGGLTLTVPSGKTLTVGDGTHASGVIFRDSGATSQTLDGAGTLDFGDAPGVLWQNHADGNNKGVALKAKIAGTKGVTFAGWQDSGYSTWSVGKDWVAGWTGPTRVCRSRVEHGSATAFPAGGDVFVEDAGEIYTTASLTYDQHFHLSGNGVTYAPIRTGGAPTLTFDGPVTLTDNLTIYHDNDGKCVFNGPVDGPGRIVHGSNNRGSVTFSVANTFSGGVTTGTSAMGLKATKTGTFGTGPVVSRQTRQDTAGVIFSSNIGTGRTPVTHVNDITCASAGLQISNSRIELLGTVSSPKTKVTNRAELGAGPSVGLGALSVDGLFSIHGATADGCVTFAAKEDTAADFSTEDGADGATLALVKEGTGTLVWSGSHTHSGATEIRAGAIRLESDIFKSPALRYWLDASDRTTWSRDEATGFVTNWNSKVGSAVFTPGVYKTSYSTTNFVGPSYTNDFNGKAVLSFYSDDGTANGLAQRLSCKREIPQRMVFIVARFPKGQGTNAGFFGSEGESEFGVRFGWTMDTSSNGALQLAAGVDYNSRSSLILDGKVQENGSFAWGKYHVFAFVHDEDDGTESAKKSANFVPSVGGYNPHADGTRIYRNAKSDIAEVLAFDRVLTENERHVVENYLNGKWKIEGMANHADVAEPPVLSAASPLAIAAKAVLDLNGSSETVASLSGYGTITNSAANEAVLRVNGACDFMGEISANVSLVTAGTSAELRPYNSLPVTNGVLYWVDASYRPDDFIVTNASGAVTQWTCRAPSAVTAMVDGRPGNWDSRVIPESWSKTCFPGEKPAVRFQKAAQLTTRTACGHLRTVFQVGYADYVGNGGGIWGKAGEESGFRFSNTSRDFNICGSASPAYMGDLVRVNGVSCRGQTTALLANGVYVLAVRFDGDSRTDLNNKQWVLGQYCSWNFGTRGWIAEALAFDRCLDDDEILSVEKYLMDKWLEGSTLVEETENPAFTLASVASAAGAGGSGTLFTGDYRITDALTVGVSDGLVNPLVFSGNVAFGTVENPSVPLYVDDWRNMSRTVREQVAVTVRGTTTGSLTKGDAEMRQSLDEGDGTWWLRRYGMVLLVK